MSDRPHTNAATLQWLPLEQLQPHPDNPRLNLREEVVAGIAEQIATRGGFSQEYALLVRPVAGGYEIVAGHHRAEAARQAGLTEVPCWVRTMSNEEAYMELGLGNTQGELTPLEVGLHAYGAVELGKGGKGAAGGLSAYARGIGRTKGYLSQLVAAAQVYTNVRSKPFTQGNRIESKTKHFYEISRAPQEHWPLLVQRLLAEDWTVETTHAAVEEFLAVALTDAELLELQRAVRKRGGTYHGAQRVNGVITRHNVTLPGQSARQYLTAHLREVLTAFDEREERLPDDLAATWELHEQEALLVARHTATGVTTEPGTVPQVSAEARQYQPDLARLHEAGWSFRRDPDGEWEALHADYGAARALRVPMLVRQADRVTDIHREKQALTLLAEQQWDAAERMILTIQHHALKDHLMATFSRAFRAWKQEQAAHTAAQPKEPAALGPQTEPEARAVGAPAAPAPAPAPTAEQTATRQLALRAQVLQRAADLAAALVTPDVTVSVAQMHIDAQARQVLTCPTVQAAAAWLLNMHSPDQEQAI